MGLVFDAFNIKPVRRKEVKARGCRTQMPLAFIVCVLVELAL